MDPINSSRAARLLKSVQDTGRNLPKPPTPHVMTPGGPGVDPTHLKIDGKKVTHAEVAGILAQKRKEIQNPGAKGGKWYRTPDGKIRYGTPPAGQHHEPIEELGSAHVKKGHTVGYKSNGEDHSGEVASTHPGHAIVDKKDGNHAAVPYKLMHSVDPPEQTESQVTHGPDDMKLGADVLFDHQGTQATGKVITWGKQGVGVVTETGKHVTVPYRALQGVMEPGQPNAPSKADRAQPEHPDKPTVEAEDVPVGSTVKATIGGKKIAGQVTKHVNHQGQAAVKIDYMDGDQPLKGLAYLHEITGVTPPKADAKPDVSSDAKPDVKPGQTITFKSPHGTAMTMTAAEVTDEGVKGEIQTASGNFHGIAYWDEIESPKAEAKPKVEVAPRVEGPKVDPEPKPAQAPEAKADAKPAEKKEHPRLVLLKKRAEDQATKDSSVADTPEADDDQADDGKPTPKGAVAKVGPEHLKLGYLVKTKDGQTGHVSSIGAIPVAQPSEAEPPKVGDAVSWAGGNRTGKVTDVGKKKITVKDANGEVHAVALTDLDKPEAEEPKSANAQVHFKVPDPSGKKAYLRKHVAYSGIVEINGKPVGSHPDAASFKGAEFEHVEVEGAKKKGFKLGAITAYLAAGGKKKDEAKSWALKNEQGHLLGSGMSQAEAMGLAQTLQGNPPTSADGTGKSEPKSADAPKATSLTDGMTPVQAGTHEEIANQGEWKLTGKYGDSMVYEHAGVPGKQLHVAPSGDQEVVDQKAEPKVNYKGETVPTTYSGVNDGDTVTVQTQGGKVVQGKVTIMDDNGGIQVEHEGGHIDSTVAAMTYLNGKNYTHHQHAHKVGDRVKFQLTSESGPVEGKIEQVMTDDTDPYYKVKLPDDPKLGAYSNGYTHPSHEEITHVNGSPMAASVKGDEGKVNGVSTNYQDYKEGDSVVAHNGEAFKVTKMIKDGVYVQDRKNPNAHVLLKWNEIAKHTTHLASSNAKAEQNANVAKTQAHLTNNGWTDQGSTGSGTEFSHDEHGSLTVDDAGKWEHGSSNGSHATIRRHLKWLDTETKSGNSELSPSRKMVHDELEAKGPKPAQESDEAKAWAAKQSASLQADAVKAAQKIGPQWDKTGDEAKMHFSKLQPGDTVKWNSGGREKTGTVSKVTKEHGAIVKYGSKTVALQNGVDLTGVATKAGQDEHKGMIYAGATEGWIKDPMAAKTHKFKITGETDTHYKMNTVGGKGGGTEFLHPKEDLGNTTGAHTYLKNGGWVKDKPQAAEQGHEDTKALLSAGWDQGKDGDWKHHEYPGHTITQHTDGTFSHHDADGKGVAYPQGVKSVADALTMMKNQKANVAAAPKKKGNGLNDGHIQALEDAGWKEDGGTGNSSVWKHKDDPTSAIHLGSNGSWGHYHGADGEGDKIDGSGQASGSYALPGLHEHLAEHAASKSGKTVKVNDTYDKDQIKPGDTVKGVSGQQYKVIQNDPNADTMTVSDGGGATQISKQKITEHTPKAQPEAAQAAQSKHEIGGQKVKSGDNLSWKTPEGKAMHGQVEGITQEGDYKLAIAGGNTITVEHSVHQTLLGQDPKIEKPLALTDKQQPIHEKLTAKGWQHTKSEKSYDDPQEKSHYYSHPDHPNHGFGVGPMGTWSHNTYPEGQHQSKNNSSFTSIAVSKDDDLDDHLEGFHAAPKAETAQGHGLKAGDHFKASSGMVYKIDAVDADGTIHYKSSTGNPIKHNAALVQNQMDNGEWSKVDAPEAPAVEKKPKYNATGKTPKSKAAQAASNPDYSSAQSVNETQPSQSWSMPKPVLPPGTQKVEMQEHGVKKITIMPEAKFEPEKLSKPVDFMNWGNSGKAGPSGSEHFNKANQAAVNAIHSAALTGNIQAVQAVMVKGVHKETGEATGQDTLATESHSSHVKGYAQQIVNELQEQQHPTEHVYYDYGDRNPIHIVSKVAIPLTGDKLKGHIAAGKKIAEYADLGHFDTLPKDMMDSMFPKGSMMAENDALSHFKKSTSKVAGGIPDNMKSAIQNLKNSSNNSSVWAGNEDGMINKASQAIHEHGFFVPSNVITHRKLSIHGAKLSQLMSSQGHVLQEMGWSHSSPLNGVWSGNVHIRMHFAPGVKSLHVGPGGGVSNSHGGEHECGLPKNTRLWVQNIDKSGGGDNIVMDVIVLPHDQDAYPQKNKKGV